MAHHTFLAIKFDLIPQATKDNVPLFWDGVFSSDISLLLIDGNSDSGGMVHPMSTLLSWVQWSENPNEVIAGILSDAIEYTYDEYQAEKNDVNSVWYIAPVGGHE